MSFIKRIGILCLFVSAGTCYGQEDLIGFLQPQISLNYSLTPHYAHNFSFTQRALFINPTNSGIGTIHLDLAHFSKFELPRQRSIGLGIMFRLREPFEGPDQNELRFTQQFNLLHRNHSIRFGHRFRTEQRIFPSRTIHRFRYRFAADGPLQGEQLDPGELYWVGNLEALTSIGKGIRPIYDLRASAWLGFLANDMAKIQIGTEYRRVGLWLEGRPVIFLLSSLILNL